MQDLYYSTATPSGWTILFPTNQSGFLRTRNRYAKDLSTLFSSVCIRRRVKGSCTQFECCGIHGGTSLLVVHGDAQGCVRSRFCALLLSCVPRKQDNGPPPGGLRRFSIKSMKNMITQQTLKRMWPGDGQRIVREKKYRESSEMKPGERGICKRWKSSR